MVGGHCLILLVASLLPVAMPFVTSSFLLLVVRPGAPSSVLAPSSDALILLVASLFGFLPVLIQKTAGSEGLPRGFSRAPAPAGDVSWVFGI